MSSETSPFAHRTANREAIGHFQRALELHPSPQITYNLTTALMNLGRLVRAAELLRQVSRDPTVSAEVRQAAEAP